MATNSSTALILVVAVVCGFAGGFLGFKVSSGDERSAVRSDRYDDGELRDEIARLAEQVQRLSREQQQKVLDFTLALKKPQQPIGEPAEIVIAAAAKVNIPLEDLEEIKQAIEEDCERIDLDGWQ